MYLGPGMLTSNSEATNPTPQVVPQQQQHPHPSPPAAPAGQLCLSGLLLLLSSWMKFRTDAPSYVRCGARDVCTYRLFTDCVRT